MLKIKKYISKNSPMIIRICSAEIDAREDAFNQTADAGEKLLDMGIAESDEVRQKLEQLARYCIYSHLVPNLNAKFKPKLQS